MKVTSKVTQSCFLKITVHKNAKSLKKGMRNDWLVNLKAVEMQLQCKQTSLQIFFKNFILIFFQRWLFIFQPTTWCKNPSLVFFKNFPYISLTHACGCFYFFFCNQKVEQFSNVRCKMIISEWYLTKASIQKPYMEMHNKCHI